MFMVSFIIKYSKDVSQVSPSISNLPDCYKKFITILVPSFALHNTLWNKFPILEIGIVICWA